MKNNHTMRETMKIRLQLALAGLAISFAWPIFAQQTNAPDTDQVRFKFQDVTNSNDPTFNQELGINNSGIIAGYFGSGAAGHPNKGYTVVRPYKTQLDFTNENFPGSVMSKSPGSTIEANSALMATSEVRIGQMTTSAAASARPSASGPI
jgi:hypothetical protein